MDIRRMLIGRGFWLGTLLAVLVMGLGAAVPEWKADTPWEAGTFLKVAASSFSSKTFLFCLPVLAVLPYGDGYLRDRERGFIRLLMVRRNRSAYAADKVLAVTAGSLLQWMLAGLSAGLLSFLLFFPGEVPGKIPVFQVKEFFCSLARTGLISAVWANLSGIIGALTHSFYMAYGLPFVVYYGLIILQERYWTGAGSWNPSRWILAEGDWGRGELGLFLFLLLFLAVTAVLHWISIAQQLKEL